ncbi:hypothetical protein C0Q70_19978 [Pomacea canaliculata]|uniref:Uncharacterized protein n=1 Tax=Pomacea canaliculata TaxID=400727 RepID=A0A2T7NE95_POMCA|nr:hypothetical protein C0Q70_19978 [Pomacea canaliculata]
MYTVESIGVDSADRVEKRGLDTKCPNRGRHQPRQGFKRDKGSTVVGRMWECVVKQHQTIAGRPILLQTFDRREHCFNACGHLNTRRRSRKFFRWTIENRPFEQDVNEEGELNVFGEGGAQDAKEFEAILFLDDE